MNNKLKVLLAVVVMSFVMVGCGGGGTSSIPSVDNSVLADDENQYGYFGDNVIFANININSDWHYRSEDNDYKYSIRGEYYPDGSGYLSNINSRYKRYFDYGVSKDGKTIKTGGDYSMTITFKQISKDRRSRVTDVDGNTKTYDCYDVLVKDNSGDFNVVMCPSPR